jgi:hypothetical protein
MNVKTAALLAPALIIPSAATEASLLKQGGVVSPSHVHLVHHFSGVEVRPGASHARLFHPGVPLERQPRVMIAVDLLQAVLPGLVYFAAGDRNVAATYTTIFLVAGTTSYTIPANWNSDDNFVGGIGAGGSGRGGTSYGAGGGGGGGGGGAWSEIVNQAHAAGAVVAVQIGAPGGTSPGVVNAMSTPPTASTDTTWNSAAILKAAHGLAYTGSTTITGPQNGPIVGGAGGAAASCVGTTKFSGGNGGTSGAGLAYGGVNNGGGAGGGGGAAGPNGAGNAGGTGLYGQNTAGAYGGTGGRGNAASGGLGGVGGTNPRTTNPQVGGAGSAGGAGTEFQASPARGCGGGGGGGAGGYGLSATAGGAGGAGGNYGAGGGGGGGASTAGIAGATGAAGAGGLIRIQYRALI